MYAERFRGDCGSPADEIMAAAVPFGGPSPEGMT
jgi:hypothetical protein